MSLRKYEAVSKHLFLLKSAGLVNDRKEKKWVHYSLDRESDDPYVAGGCALPSAQCGCG